ncbi:hypothetical protein [Hymenobacter metallicola]|uniref:Glycosyltransferase RgtA/B/C/D-like domain-containing protein n=1 Tax=Hymenobacter metallicola TaxID=2563114 RepID=A0A4Z0QE12_9BACT|nr:hypothetical protein [Hymenobacter metallicola]TGE27589.1 hypothetical protein E5K02_14555 [Hymenobacter metallicola]
MSTAFLPFRWSDFGRSLALAAAYAVLLGGVAFLLAPHTVGPVFTQAGFSNWDVIHYLRIRDTGFSPESAAFFPLFPFVWRWLGVSPMAMAGLNLGLFLLAFAALSAAFAFSRPHQLLLLSIPTLVFMGLPYSEALFFGAGVLVLLGWQRQSLALLAVGLLLSCLTRSAAFVLVPATLLTAYLTSPDRPVFWRQASVGTGAATAGLLLSVYLHYRDTKRWFVFFEAQKLWDNRLRWPQLPLSNWGGSFPTHYEAVCFFLALAAAVYLLYLLKQGPALPASTWAPRVFSLAYVAGVTFVTVATKGGVLVSLSRYVLATPYFLLLAVAALQTQWITNRRLLWAVGLTEVCWLLGFGSYGHIRSVLGYSVLTLYLLLVLACLHTHPRIRQVAYGVLLPLNSVLLVVLLYRFLQNQWVA